MGKIIKFLLGTVLTLILLSVIGLVMLVTLVNVNNLKPTISKQFYSLTGHTLTINGNISWTLFPWLSLQVNDAQIDNPPGFPAAKFATLNAADFSIKLLPLLKGNIDVGAVVIKGLTVNLIKNSDGKGNWQNFLTNQHTSLTIAQNQNSPLNQSIFTISSISASNANIYWHDMVKQQEISLTHLQFFSNNVSLNHAFPIRLITNFSIAKLNKPTLAGKININTKTQINFLQKTVSLSPLTIESQLINKKSPDGLMKFSMQMNALLNWQNQTLLINKSNGVFINLPFQATAEIKQLFNRPNIEGYLNVASFDLKKFFTALGISMPQQNQGQAEISFQTPIYYKNDALTIAPIHAEMYQGQYHGRIEINLNNAEPTYATKGSITHLQTGLLYNALVANKSIQLTGDANVQMSLATSGKNSNDLLKNLQGNINYAINNGVVKGINIKRSLQMAAALFNKQIPNTQDNELNQTPFDALQGTINFHDGIANNDDLTLTSPILHATGNGQVNLLNQNINYKLTVNTINSGIAKLDQLQKVMGGGIPIKISGTLADIHVMPDQAAIAEATAKIYINKNADKIKTEINKQASKIGGKLGGEIQKEVSSFFGKG